MPDTNIAPVSITGQIAPQYTHTEEESLDILPECPNGDDEDEAQLGNTDNIDEEGEEAGAGEADDRVLENAHEEGEEGDEEEEDDQRVAVEDQEEEVGEEQQEDDEDVNDVRFPSNPLRSPYSGMFHRVPHEYVNDTAAETMVSLQSQTELGEDDEVSARQDVADRSEEYEESAVDNEQRVCFFSSRIDQTPNGVHSPHSTHNCQGLHTNIVYPDLDEAAPGKPLTWMSSLSLPYFSI